MNLQAENTTKDVTARRSLRYALIMSAGVTGLFSLVVLVCLTASYVRSTLSETRLEKQMEALRARLRAEPANEPLQSEIRQLDLEFRHNKLRWLRLARPGAYLLLGGVVTFLICLKCIGWLSDKTPMPTPVQDVRKQQLQLAADSRWMVAVASMVVLLIAVVLAMLPAIKFGPEVVQDTSYPSVEEINRNWPRFRGPGGSGISAYTNVPKSWNGATGQGIAWKTEVPLPGHNSPIIWGDKVFLSGADANEQKVFCFDAQSGALVWTGDVPVRPLRPGEEPLKLGDDTGYAASTMATDGRRVYAIFPTGEVASFDFNGKKVWQKSLGRPESAYGYTSSLDMYQNLLLIQFDQGEADDEKSRLIAIEGYSGRVAWETKRPVPNSWSSAIVVQVGSQPQCITVADPWVISYNPADGAEIWRAKCVGGEIAPSPIYVGGLVFAIEPYTQLVAIRPDGRGDVTKTHIAWRSEEGGPDICCPVGNDQIVLTLDTSGLLSCFKVADGTRLWEHDLKEDFRASPSLVGDTVYLLSQKGVMHIAQVGSEYKELARCELGEKCQASPAFADGRIYIRGLKNLHCIGGRPGQP
jgi:outer membrane protein assembly factor BamB